MSRGLIGIDWGTSSFRAWRMDAGGQVMDIMGDGPGILAAAAAPGGFEGALERAIGGWLSEGQPVIASGMITSRNGWVETPYLPLPLDAAALAGALLRHPSRFGALHFTCGAVSDPDGPAPDVMRGEETEIIGHLATGDGADGLFVLPGTHSKWARVRGGRLTGFRTVMTGEIFAAMRDHSILGRLAEPGPFDAEAFASGVRAGAADGPLLGRVFAARSLALMGRLRPAAIADYLSGLLIGDEVAQEAARAGDRAVTIIGRGDLADRYRIACAGNGIVARVAAPGMAQKGLWNIARKAGIV
ncbi:2-dehydro-3-deoxygalactonokinase [Paracoccus sp. MKU1]|uniref:2-dehydro-3-deoxygalactonokinase n=1 Tax=Paracoccus sp. MKU1 TaxID=1745182 RepID=UPI000719316C|nr:2-dehydro-3-deoxygalactonokinase [Paracoccus sp. MKU1]KRW97567.1 hypothetical protein AQY21_02930 [Paracoccus sp. MKU1]